MTDGYGLNIHLIQRAYDDGVDTVLTCDNGIAAAEEIAFGKDMGMTVIVTDHHEVPFEEWIRNVRTVNILFHIYAERQWHINSWKLSGNLWGGTPKIWTILLKMLLLLR